MNTLEFLQSTNGELSSKRLAGLFLIVSGVIMKFVLFIYGLGHVVVSGYQTLDNTADSMIFAGAGLLGISIAEHIWGQPKKGEKSNAE